MTDSKEKIVFIIVVTVLALFGGLAGDLIFRQFLPESYFIPQLSQVDISSGRPGGSFLIRDAKNVVITQDSKSSDIVSSALSGYLAVFKKEDGRAIISSSSSDLFYDMSKSVGQGITLTSDGWAATSLVIDKPADLIVFDSNKKVFYIDKVVRDQTTGFSFFHVESKDLTVQKFSAGSHVSNGQTVIAVNLIGGSWLSNVVDGISGEQSFMSSDNQASKIKLLQSPTKEFYGTALFDLSGECIGFIDSTGGIKHVSQFRAVINSLLKNGNISRPEFGVSYLDLSKMYISGNGGGVRNGLLISSQDGKSAVAKGKAADLAGMKDGDIIISINGEKIFNGHDFYNTLQNFMPGNSIGIEYQRAGKTQEVEVLLTTIKSTDAK